MPDLSPPSANRDEPTGDISGPPAPAVVDLPDEDPVASARGLDRPWETEYPPQPPGGRW